jgi:hypothetical protein
VRGGQVGVVRQRETEGVAAKSISATQLRDAVVDERE